MHFQIYKNKIFPTKKTRIFQHLYLIFLFFFLSQWKRLWQLVSGINFETPTKIVNEELSSVTPQLLDGLKQFHTNKPGSDPKLKDVLKKSGQEKLLTFTQKLQQYLVRFFVTLLWINDLKFCCRIWTPSKHGTFSAIT